MGIFSNNPDYWRGRSSRSSSGGSSKGGVRIEIDDDAIELNIKHIENMMTTNPEMHQRIQEAIKHDVLAARNSVVRNMAGIFKNGDPAGARRAVRHVVYQKILGANLNIFEMRRGTAKWRVRQVERKVDQNPKMRGGNRIKRTMSTIKMHGYEGKARGMILRWVNTGTDDRVSRYGKRDSITARNFFGPMAQSALDVVSQHLAQIIEEEIENVFNQD